ncbi:LysE family translocator [Shimia marina]|uniref:Homoserine/homoserine lactone efflux protein n=1 Tax=Shimia marina TaxID=321267 RepID=A0A0P1ERZ0_9RHOB|nr:LysE family translocator [Shimia marina]CUH52871.1 Homoserine/homoserine lactone efflux protein [Shimia marina]SFD89257.1 Threonine/homoserine/homoserine lactone efflux protein [Shimia marina]
MSFDLWLTFVAASTALLLIPGPTILLVLSYALTQGRKVAVATAAGVAFGDLIAMSASLMGLGAIVLASATAFMVLKWLGAAYLMWLGYKMLRSAGNASLADISRASDLPGRGVFGHAAAVTALNPKSIGFFIAFVPQFLSPQAPMLPQFAIFISTFVTLAALNALAYALLADKMRSRISSPKVMRGLTRGGGVTLMGMGILTATLKRAA